MHRHTDTPLLFLAVCVCVWWQSWCIRSCDA